MKGRSRIVIAVVAVLVMLLGSVGIAFAITNGQYVVHTLN